MYFSQHRFSSYTYYSQHVLVLLLFPQIPDCGLSSLSGIRLRSMLDHIPIVTEREVWDNCANRITTKFFASSTQTLSNFFFFEWNDDLGLFFQSYWYRQPQRGLLMKVSKASLPWRFTTESDSELRSIVSLVILFSPVNFQWSWHLIPHDSLDK